MAKIRCPEGCDTSEEPFPFFYPPSCLRETEDTADGMPQEPELGIFADEEANLTNTWTDGTVGTSGWEDDGCMPVCVVCHNEARRQS